MVKSIIQGIDMYKVSTTGSVSVSNSSTEREENAEVIKTQLGVRTVVPSSQYLAQIYAGEESLPYIMIGISSGVRIYSGIGSSYVVLKHHTTAVDSARRIGPTLYYVLNGNYVLLGVSTGSPKQFDIIIDKENLSIGYLSDDGMLFTIIDKDGGVHVVPMQDFIDSVNIVSLSKLIVPDMDLLYDDLFAAAYMRACPYSQQFRIEDTEYFSSGNPSTDDPTAPQFILKIK